VYDLRPPSLDELGLVGALRTYAVNLSSRVQVVIDAPASLPSLSAAVEVAAFRIAQEALTNVQRHAQASTATVLLNFDKSSVSLVVSDDGIGGLSNANDTGKQVGLGLVGMRERAHLLGGDLHIESQPGKGTRITFEVPLMKVQEYVYDSYPRIAG
jgi:signal transduction histidine kinase